ncbi:SDR family oxidoreductase [bacterium]|nr:SDR family oxidoreductase [bacterium]
MKLRNQVAIVTGSGRGIGKAIALTYAREGADVVAVARTKSEIEELTEEIRSIGRKALAIPTDISQKKQVQAMVQQVLDEFGTVDILVNNAGVAIHNYLMDIREEDWDLTMAVNLKGVFLCTQAVFPIMMEKRSGHIINISSGAGKRGSPRFGSYCASKFGVMGFTEAIAAEGRPHNIKVCVICPGPVTSKMRSDNHPDDDPTKLMMPQDIADMALFLVTQHPRSYIPEVQVRTMWM